MKTGDGQEIPDEALSFSFVRASGPGGQNVNKVATAVEMRVAVRALGLDQLVLVRLRKLAGRRLTKGDEIVIDADRFRTQERNRQDALDRLGALIREAQAIPKARKKTKPTKAAREERLADKKRRSVIKSGRRGGLPD